MNKKNEEVKIRKNTLILAGIIVILLLVIVGMAGVMLGGRNREESSGDSSIAEKQKTEQQEDSSTEATDVQENNSVATIDAQQNNSEETTDEQQNNSEETTDAQQNTTDTQASNSQGSGAYNISNGLQARISDGTGFMQNDYFYLIFNYDDFAEGLWEFYATDANTIKFYYTKAKAAGYGGWVFSLVAYDWGDNGYEEYPEYSIAGLSEEKKYIAVFSTDVQFDPNDQTQQEEYSRLLTYAKRIDQTNKDNPLAVGY